MKKLGLILFLILVSALAKAQVPTPNLADGITVCVGSTGVFAWDPIDPGYTYTFAVDNGETITPISANTQGQITWDAPGVYTVTITATNACGWTATTAIVNVQPQGILAMVPLEDCLSNVVTLNGPPGTVYTPTNGGTIVGDQFTPPSTGVFIIDGTFTDASGCVSTGSVTVTILTVPPTSPIYTDQ